MKALIEKADGSYIYNKYLEDSKDCLECQAIWQQLKQDDDRNLAVLLEAVKKHLEKT